MNGLKSLAQNSEFRKALVQKSLPIMWLVCLGAALGVLHVTFTLDETFVLLRYAENLASGEGAVFNIGERVDGLTSPLWVGLLFVMSFLPGDLLLYAKFFSFLSYILVGLLVLKIVMEEGGDSRIACLLYLGSAPLILWGVSGMEALLYSLLYLLVFYKAGRAHLKKADWKLGLLLVLLVAARPESFLIALVCLAWFAWHSRLSLKFFASVVAVVFTLFLCRHLYYGQWFPNIMHTRGLNEMLEWGGNLKSYFLSYFLGPGVLFLFTGLWLFRVVPIKKMFMLLSFVVAQFIFVIFTGGDWMPGWRLFVPIIPLFILMAVELHTRLSHKYQSLWLQPIALATVLVYVAVNYNYSTHIVPFKWGVPGFHSFETASLKERSYERVVYWLHNQKGKINSIALREPGYVGYHTGLTCFGLREAGNRNPDLILISEQATDGPKQFLMNGRYHKVEVIGKIQVFARSFEVDLMATG